MVAIYMYFQQHSQFLLVRVSSQAGWTASRDTGHHCVQPRLRHCGVQRLRKGVGGSLDQQLGGHCGEEDSGGRGGTRSLLVILTCLHLRSWS